MSNSITGQENCDICGRFVWPNSPGTSWCQTYTHLDLNDPTFRCSRCTDEHGVKQSNCNPNSGPWSGRNPSEVAETRRAGSAGSSPPEVFSDPAPSSVEER
mgnify:CR=1 FL=1